MASNVAEETKMAATVADAPADATTMTSMTTMTTTTMTTVMLEEKAEQMSMSAV